MLGVKVTFLHPDLGIGGAERLVVDAAVALKNKGYEVNIVTSHHDPTHCFSETKDGTIPVTVAGDWLPRSVLGMFFALFAYIRMIYAALYLIFFSRLEPDLVICDQVSVAVPVLHYKFKNVLFYCHFPDLLQSVRSGPIKTLYRMPIDWIEEVTTGCADRILVNSAFTRQVFKATFQSLSTIPDILHPSINTENFQLKSSHNFNVPDDSVILLSINRYERKKNLSLAIRALHVIKNKYSNTVPWEKVQLILAGGYDVRVEENIYYYKELKDLAKSLNLSDKVLLLKSPSDSEKVSLLNKCVLLIYTPAHEHFGIVPLEAMYAKKPVISVNSGGPCETVLNGVTGYLCEPAEEDFAKAISDLLGTEGLVEKMGNAGRQRFEKHFSFQAFSDRLNEIVVNLLSRRTS